MFPFRVIPLVKMFLPSPPVFQCLEHLQDLLDQVVLVHPGMKEIKALFQRTTQTIMQDQLYNYLNKLVKIIDFLKSLGQLLLIQWAQDFLPIFRSNYCKTLGGNA